MKQSVAVAALVACASGCGWVRPSAGTQGTVRAYIVHHVEYTMEKLAAQFERETGIHVDTTYACRGVVGVPRPPGRPSLHQMATGNRDGDIYITSRRSDLEDARKRKLGSREIIPIAELVPVIEVIKGNPENIRSLGDLAREGVRLSLGHEKSCVGNVTEQILAKNKLTDKVKPNVVLRVKGEKNIAKSVDGKKTDATIVWLSTLREVGPENYEPVLIPVEQNLIEPLSLLVLDTGRNKAAARRFAQFLQSPRAQKLFAADGLRRPK